MSEKEDPPIDKEVEEILEKADIDEESKPLEEEKDIKKEITEAAKKDFQAGDLEVESSDGDIINIK